MPDGSHKRNLEPLNLEYPEQVPEQELRTEWEQFFDSQAPTYLQNKFTNATKEEVDFFLSLYELPAHASILDIGCGVGRHAIELSKRGFRVTAVDISEGMLRQAAKAAGAAGVDIDFVKADATDFVTRQPMDAAICLCEGAFNLIGKEEDPLTHDLAILKNISASLKPDAPFLLTALNGYSIIRQMTDEAVEKRSFEPLTMLATYEDTWSLPQGPTVMQIRERLYIPPEVNAMLWSAGFRLQALYGGTAGDWGRRPLKLDEVEAMYVARKR